MFSNKLLKRATLLFLGIACGLVVTTLAGENPWHILKIMAKSATGSRYDFGMTLFYATPLLLTGLSVSIAFRAGLFNIGAEGQLTLGALAAATVGGLFPQWPAPLSWIAATLAAMTAGGFWGAIAAWLKARRGTHEVISTILLNFVAQAIASYVTLNLIRNPESQNPETIPIGPAYRLEPFAFFDAAPVGASLWIVLIVAVLCFLLLERTRLGFRIRAVGENPLAARLSGIGDQRVQIIALALAGAVSGLVAVPEILGNAGLFRLGFSPGFGFTGIAVALLVRGEPLLVIASALFFGALHKGALDLDMETDKITQDLTLVIQACVILAMAAEGFRLKRKKVK